MNMHQTARFRAGTLVVGVMIATAFLVPQYTYAYTGVCKYFNVVLTPFGFCAEEIVAVLPEPAPEYPSNVIEEVEPSNIAVRVIEKPGGMVAGTSSAPIEDKVTEPAVVYITDPAWRNYARQVNTLFGGIVDYLANNQERSSSDTSTIAGDDDFVTRELWRKQTDRIYDSSSDSLSDLSNDLAESVETDLLTVSGNGTLTGFLTSDTYVSAPYLTATDAAATSTLTNLSVSGNSSFSGSLTLAALGGGLLQTDANGVVSTTTVGAASVTDDSLDFAAFVDAFTLDATATFNLDTNNADWNIDSNTFFVDSSANRIGLGNAAPSALLHILGTTEQLRLGYDATNYWGDTIASDGGRSVAAFGSDADFNLDFSGATDGDFSINTNNLFVDTSTGNVGIGTTDPQKKLHINSETFNDHLLITRSGSGSAITQSGTVASIAPYGSTNLLTIFSGLHVTSTGNVGIGTTAPSQKLQVSGNVQIGTGSGGYLYGRSGQILVGEDTAGSYVHAGTNIAVAANLFIGRMNTDTIFQTNGGIERMRIASGGNVGIGTTSPAFKLSVSGRAGFSGLTGSTGGGSLCLSASNEVVFNSGSDACLPSLRETKHDIQTLDFTALDLVNQLDSVSFVYNQGDGRTRYGFIAEDAAAVDVLLATYDAEGNISGIDDRSMIAVVVKAMQEMWTQVKEYFVRTETLEAEVETLRARIEALESGNTYQAPDEETTDTTESGGGDAEPPEDDTADVDTASTTADTSTTSTPDEAPAANNGESPAEETDNETTTDNPPTDDSSATAPTTDTDDTAAPADQNPAAEPPVTSTQPSESGT